MNQYYRMKSITFGWLAQYYVPVDALLYIGQLPGADERTFVATGLTGME